MIRSTINKIIETGQVGSLGLGDKCSSNCDQILQDAEWQPSTVPDAEYTAGYYAFGGIELHCSGLGPGDLRVDLIVIRPGNFGESELSGGRVAVEGVGALKDIAEEEFLRKFSKYKPKMEHSFSGTKIYRLGNHALAVFHYDNEKKNNILYQIEISRQSL